MNVVYQKDKTQFNSILHLTHSSPNGCQQKLMGAVDDDGDGVRWLHHINCYYPTQTTERRIEGRC